MAPTFDLQAVVSNAQDYVEKNKKTVVIAAGATSVALVRANANHLAPHCAFIDQISETAL